MSNRPQELLTTFQHLIDRHLDDLVHCRATEMLEIEAFADQLHVHPTHLSNTIKELTGSSPCGIYQLKISGVVKALLANPGLSIRSIAIQLDFEPSQFSKWFQRINGLTPKAYRKLKS